MKKLLSLLLAAAMVLSLAACIAREEDTGGIVIWHDKEDAVAQVLQAYLDEALPDLDITLEKKTSLTDSLKLVGNDPSSAPDMFIFAHDKIGVFAEMGILADIEGLLPEGELENYLDMTTEAAAYKGTAYQLPLYFETLLFMYNRRYMTDDKAPSTTEELYAYMQANTGRDRYGFVEQHSTAYYSAAWIHGFGGEIISADSMQIYKGLDVGTAKVTPEETRGIPHHGVDILQPDEPFSVADFTALAGALEREISGRGHLPILVGGTGLYVQSFLYGVRFAAEKTPDGLREQLAAELNEKGPEAMYAELQAVDPEAAAAIHPNNHVRVLRALEHYRATGKKLSEQKADSLPPEKPYRSLILGLDFPERAQLYRRIDLRVEMDAVPVEEIESSVRGESSADVRARVLEARRRQTVRYAGLPFHCNAQLDQPGIERFCGLDATASKLLRQAVERFRLSMRAYGRIRKVARTVADLAGHDAIQVGDVALALQFRTADGPYGG